MSESQDIPQFVQQVIDIQPRLYGFVLALLMDRNAADDVVQETNAVLWAKREQFEPGTNFVAWAFRIARYQVMAHQKSARGDRHVFNAEMVNDLSGVLADEAERADDTRAALRRCMDKLSDEQRELLDSRYGRDEKVADLAGRINRPAGALYQSLFRIRAALLDCINYELAANP